MGRVANWRVELHLPDGDWLVAEVPQRQPERVVHRVQAVGPDLGDDPADRFRCGGRRHLEAGAVVVGSADGPVVSPQLAASRTTSPKAETTCTRPIAPLKRAAWVPRARLTSPRATYTTKPLTAETWPDFARLVEANNGVWGGCWCMGFHPKGEGWGKSAELNRAEKELRVVEDRAHAALVFDGADCVGWCQFGVPDELPRIKNQKAYLADLDELPDWRITCFFVDKGHRGEGVAAAALAGALEEIARLGGGTVESYPDEAQKKTSASFLHNATIAMFERQGFERTRLIGKTRWVVRKVVRAIGAR